MSEVAPGADALIERQAGMLKNRVAKNARNLARWARREGVAAYRVYDCDIPELPLTVDRYATEDDGVHAVVAVWHGRSQAIPGWTGAMGRAIAEALALEPARLHLKTRARQEGARQYERLATRDVRHVVREDGLAFVVNLDDYLDTGLFLDHRVMRRMVRAEAAGRRVLNLFAYTGAFSVHAAAGGAAHVTTIDMSQTYLDWARDNLAANGLAGPRCELVRADVMQWLATPSGARWDMAIVDPPTFSNSKKMRGVFDVQRDHAWLLQRVRERLVPGGVIWFSCNARRFKPDPAAFAGMSAVREISQVTVPFDFRDKKIHRAWRLECA